MSKKVLVTGVAGFIGSRVAYKLLERGYEVVGIDNINDYYDMSLKHKRLETLHGVKGFKFYRCDIENLGALEIIFAIHGFDAVINEAARPGVRYSIENPFVYFQTNVIGNLNLLELCKRKGVGKYVLASTSSLYAGQKMPFVETLEVNTPISPYAASKKSAEATAYTYHFLHGIDITVFRYFTVYGPAGRPDMAPFRFIKWIIEGTPLTVYGDGNQSRDFTYVDDIAEGTILGLKPLGYEVINIGNNNPDKLNEMIRLIEKATGKKAAFVYEEFHKADMTDTWADIGKATALLGWQPTVGLADGIDKTVKWTLDNWDWVSAIRT